MVAADGSELNERLVAARLDGVVPEESYTVLDVGIEIYAPPDHWRGGRVHVTNPFESLVKGTDLSGVVHETVRNNQVLIRAINDHRALKRGGGSWGLVIKTLYPAEAGAKEAEPSVYVIMFI